MHRLEILALIVIALVILGTPAAVFGYEAFLRSQNPNEITIIARAPENGNWSQTAIHVKQGDTVKLRLTSDDVAHGLSIPAFQVDVHEIYPGKFTTAEFVADKAGTFPFFCNDLCSPKHGEMRGQIIVEPASPQTGPAEPAPAKAADTAANPPINELAQGKQAFQAYCGACHGSNAEGGFGPPIAGRSSQEIVNKVRNSKGQMPEYTQRILSDSDLDKIAKFLGSIGNGQAQPAPAKPADAAAKPSTDALAQGKQAFQSQCAACHGPNAQGAFGPSLVGRSKQEITNKVRNAKGQMPSFPPERLSDADLDKLVQFIASLGN